MAVPRTKCLSTKLTNAEYATLEALAGDQSISEWAREVLLQAATRRAAEQIIVAELMALRTILLNLHFAVAAGETVTTDTMQRLIEQADHDKIRKAQERLAPASLRRRP
jgi:hypothetical protein